jgi:hypothetical protein
MVRPSAKVVAVIYGLVAFLSFVKQEFVRQDLQEKYQLLALIPSWPWWGWTIVGLVALVVLLLEGSARVIARYEASANARAGFSVQRFRQLLTWLENETRLNVEHHPNKPTRDTSTAVLGYLREHQQEESHRELAHALQVLDTKYNKVESYRPPPSAGGGNRAFSIRDSGVLAPRYTEEGQHVLRIVRRILTGSEDEAYTLADGHTYTWRQLAALPDAQRLTAFKNHPDLKEFYLRELNDRIPEHRKD